MMKVILKVYIIPALIFLGIFGVASCSPNDTTESDKIGILMYEKDIKARVSYHEHYIVLVDNRSRSPSTSLPNEEFYLDITNNETFRNEFNFVLFTERGSLSKSVSAKYHLYDSDFNPIIVVEKRPDDYDGETFVSKNFVWVDENITLTLDYMGFTNVTYVYMQITASWQPPHGYSSEAIFTTVFKFSD